MEAFSELRCRPASLPTSGSSLSLFDHSSGQELLTFKALSALADGSSLCRQGVLRSWSQDGPACWVWTERHISWAVQTVNLIREGCSEEKGKEGLVKHRFPF